MNFALRRRPPLPSGWALTGRYPRARYISPQPTPGSTRTVSSSFPPLPKNLPEPPAYPCPHLSDFDVLKPLYQRNWKVCTSYNNASDVKKVALEKKFMLKKYQPTLEFFNEVMGLQGICAQEKHHPIGVRFTFTTLTFTLKTSNAVPPRSLSNAPRSPGITLRDVRLAILIEKTFEDKFVSSGKGLESADAPAVCYQPSDPTQVIP